MQHTATVFDSGDLVVQRRPSGMIVMSAHAAEYHYASIPSRRKATSKSRSMVDNTLFLHFRYIQKSCPSVRLPTNKDPQLNQSSSGASASHAATSFTHRDWCLCICLQFKLLGKIQFVIPVSLVPVYGQPSHRASEMLRRRYSLLLSFKWTVASGRNEKVGWFAGVKLD